MPINPYTTKLEHLNRLTFAAMTLRDEDASYSDLVIEMCQAWIAVETYSRRFDEMWG